MGKKKTVDKAALTVKPGPERLDPETSLARIYEGVRIPKTT